MGICLKNVFLGVFFLEGGGGWQGMWGFSFILFTNYAVDKTYFDPFPTLRSGCELLQRASSVQVSDSYTHLVDERGSKFIYRLKKMHANIFVDKGQR